MNLFLTQINIGLLLIVCSPSALGFGIIMEITICSNFSCFNMIFDRTFFWADRTSQKTSWKILNMLKWSVDTYFEYSEKVPCIHPKCLHFPFTGYSRIDLVHEVDPDNYPDLFMDRCERSIRFRWGCEKIKRVPLIRLT